MNRTGEFCGRVATSSASHALLMTLFWCLFLALAGALLFGLLFLALFFVQVGWIWLSRHFI